MLPSSHSSPILGLLPPIYAGRAVQDLQAPAGSEEFAEITPAERASLETSVSALALADAFAQFVSTSSKLEGAYRELQGDVADLRSELAERNAELKKSLAETEDVRRALQQIVDSMPCGAIVAKTDGTLTTVNPEALRLLEMGAAEAIPASLEALAARTELDLSFLRGVQQGIDAELEVCRHTAAGDRWLHLFARQIELPTQDGSAGLTILILRDTTANKRAEAEREETRRATVLAQITSMLAHEIRNPLGSLELFAGLIEEDASGRAEWISNLRAGIRSLSGTVNNVLSMHDSGSLALSPICLAEVVEGMMRFTKPVADQAGIALRWKASTHDGEVLGNENALQQVLLNLIRNAVRHTPAGGSVTLSVDLTSAREVVLCCTDTGCGLREDQRSRLFQAGFSGRGDSPGLGLAVCERMMAQHGGSIAAENAPDGGAMFVLRFPSLKQESAA